MRPTRSVGSAVMLTALTSRFLAASRAVVKLARLGVGAGAGFDGGDDGASQCLVDGEQRPHFLFESGWVGRAQHAAGGEGVVQCQVGDLVFPAFVVEGDEPARGIVARVR